MSAANFSARSAYGTSVATSLPPVSASQSGPAAVAWAMLVGLQATLTVMPVKSSFAADGVGAAVGAAVGAPVAPRCGGAARGRGGRGRRGAAVGPPSGRRSGPRSERPSGAGAAAALQAARNAAPAGRSDARARIWRRDRRRFASSLGVRGTSAIDDLLLVRWPGARCRRVA